MMIACVPSGTRTSSRGRIWPSWSIIASIDFSMVDMEHPKDDFSFHFRLSSTSCLFLLFSDPAHFFDLHDVIKRRWHLACCTIHNDRDRPDAFRNLLATFREWCNICSRRNEKCIHRITNAVLRGVNFLFYASEEFFNGLNI